MRNYTEYHGAEEWLRETYPHLHAVWLQTFSNPEEFSVMNMQLTCMVCQIKPSSGLHYGVKMCEADKQFLKRTFHYQIAYPRCGQEGASVCPPRPRGWCQICRLRRCLSTPVTISMIRVGNKSPPVKQPKNQPTPLFTIKVEAPPKQSAVVSKEEIDFIEQEMKPFVVDHYQLLKPEPLMMTHTETSAPYNNSAFDLSANTCQPLDLRISRKKIDAEWLSHDNNGSQGDLPLQYVLQNYDEPLDLSPLSYHPDQIEAADLSRPSSRESSYIRTPSPVLDASQAFNKLTVNSAVLGDALSRIQGNISMSNSLVNLSSVSDILSETNREF